jgi:hypothetical protein
MRGEASECMTCGPQMVPNLPGALSLGTEQRDIANWPLTSERSTRTLRTTVSIAEGMQPRSTARQNQLRS